VPFGSAEFRLDPVGVMYPNEDDGNAVRGFLPDAFKKAGFTAGDAARFLACIVRHRPFARSLGRDEDV